LASITLGKMLQSEPARSSDVRANYLRAAHVQPNGELLSFEDDQTMWFSPGELDSYELVRGDVVVVEGGAGYGRSALIVDPLPGWGFQNSIIRLRPDPARADGRFLNYALQAACSDGSIALVCSTATIPHFTAEKVAPFPVPVPDVPKQRMIAEFLDRETAKIDALIEQQEKLIAILQWRRRDVIWATVTGGSAFGASDALERRVLPFGWAVCRVHYDYEVVLGKMLDAGRAAGEDEMAAPYIRAANIQDFGLELADVKTMPFHPSELTRLSLRRGDLLVVEGGASYGKSVWLETDLPGWGFQKTINRVRSRGAGSTRFLGYVLQGLRDRGILALHSDGSTLPHLTAETLRGLRIPRPPTDEQERLADFLDTEVGVVGALTAKVEEFIRLTRERRAALITAAVTGQFDVSTGKVA